MADYGGLLGVLTKKNAMGDDLPFSRTPQDQTQNLSCYSIRYPPELDSDVLVQVERVDETGVWGSLVDWGEECTAYLPIGSIGKEKGRGERKAQMHFLTRARRSKQQKNPITFVASVQTVEQMSRNGVATKGLDIEQEQFHVVVTRRGVTDESEKKAMDLSRNVQYCAFLVDKAASQAGFSRLAARKLTLYASYERALAAALGDDDDDKDNRNDDEEEFIPEDAPVKFLFETIGNLTKDQVSSVLGLLGEDGRADDDRIRPFAASLLDICRRENERRSQPSVVDLTIAVGGSKAALKALESGHVKDANSLLDQRHLFRAVSFAKNVSVPHGCDAGTIQFEGNGKYKLITQAPPKLEETARGYLESIGKTIQKTWESSTTNALPAEEKQLPQSETSRSDGEATPSVQPTINIGVIGDVANGKSTLVKALSGKKTQAHSSEQQQHGITIRLGFANAGVLQCRTCHSFSFLPESHGDEGHLPLCSKCESATKVVQRFSLIDCPGHAELMATMLAGASAFDAVLLAAAANVPCPTPQARQHLQAIKLSGILKKNAGRACIAIAQTKAELVADPSKNALSLFTPGERLAHHAEEGRDKLAGSAACDAPIFPVCAPLGIGLEAIAEWIARIPNASRKIAQHDSAQYEPTRLQVLRSFDVNRPGSAAEHLHGGVLGGTILGGGRISLGDELEVRPGLCSPRSHKKKPSKEQQQPGPFNVQPLRFHCTSLMTGKTPLSSATRGGLVAVGTSLDPSVCADNRLVGSVAGAPGSLPPVWGPVLLLNQLEFVDALAGPSNGNMTEGSKAQWIKPSELLKRGSEIRCHVGSATIKGVVAKISKSVKKLEIHLDGPVCASIGANVALEGKDSNTRSHVLVAHAKLFGGDLCQEGYNPTEGSQATTSSSSYDDDNEDAKFSSERAAFETKYRQQFLEDLESSQAAERGVGGTSRLSVPSPDILRDGGAHVLLSNFGLIAHALRREPEHMVLYLEKEGGIKSVLAGNRSSPATLTLRVHWRGGRGFSERFSSILKKYILAYVTCKQCRGAVTELLHGKAELCCRRCNARRFVAKL